MSHAISLPPELLLQIFSIVSDSPSNDHKRYLERNRNLKAFAVVHKTWRYTAQEVLTEEIYADVRELYYYQKRDQRKMQKSDQGLAKEVTRRTRRLIHAGCRRPKYLTFEGYINDLVGRTRDETWGQVRYLRLLNGSADKGVSMRDFECFSSACVLSSTLFFVFT